MSTRTKQTREVDDYLRLARRFPPRPIRNAGEYDLAVSIMETLAVRDEGSLRAGEQDYLAAITEFVSIYGNKRFPIGGDGITGLDALKFLMEQREMKQIELAGVLGIGTGAVSMILSGDRPITADHARALGKLFSVELGLFLRQPV